MYPYLVLQFGFLFNHVCVNSPFNNKANNTTYLKERERRSPGLPIALVKMTSGDLSASPETSNNCSGPGMPLSQPKTPSHQLTNPFFSRTQLKHNFPGEPAHTLNRMSLSLSLSLSLTHTFSCSSGITHTKYDIFINMFACLSPLIQLPENGD